MAVWDWDDVPHETLVLDGNAPAAATLAASLVPPEPPITAAYDTFFEERSGHPLLQLCEWGVSSLIPEIFAMLRGSGSKFGFVVEQGHGWKPAGICRKIALDEATALRIFNDFAMDPTMAFVDDTGRCALASWWSDDCWIAMEPILFETWLSTNPLQMWIDGDWRRYDSFTSAKVAADKWKADYLRSQEEGRARNT